MLPGSVTNSNSEQHSTNTLHNDSMVQSEILIASVAIQFLESKSTGSTRQNDGTRLIYTAKRKSEPGVQASVYCCIYLNCIFILWRWNTCRLQ